MDEHSKKSEQCGDRRTEGKRKHNDVKDLPSKRQRVQVIQADSNSESSYSRS